MGRLDGELDKLVLENLTYRDGNLYWVTASGRRSHGPVGSVNNRGYRVVSLAKGKFRKTLQCHRVIWFLCYGNWPVVHIDHIDGNKLNNQISNLRQATPKQNSQNRKHNTNSLVKFKGVSYRNKDDVYESVIGSRVKNNYLGRSKCPLEAALMYNHAAEKMFGPYAKFNLVFEDVAGELLNGET
jgi:hypothetical protein